MLNWTGKISSQPAVKPQGGFGYFFQGTTAKAKNDFTCDQYRFYSNGRHFQNGILKRYYKIIIANTKGKVLSSDFQRHVYTLCDNLKTSATAVSEAPVCLVHYVGDSTIHVDSKHGNAKKKTGFYLPTLKSVMTEISSKSDNMTPKLVYDQLPESTSNEKSQSRMPVDRPRDRKQCENVKYNDSKKKKISNDELYSTMELAVQTNNFVRKFTIYPDLLLHLASENILSVTKDITQTSNKNLKLKQLISYDTTFLLGEFYVSIVVARNIYFQGEPIFPVAFLIHDKKFRKYHQEFLKDIFEAAGLAKAVNIPFVTNREKGITESFKTCFPQLTNVYCTNHILRDIEYWLRNKGGKEDIKVLKDDITRLIQCENETHFQEMYKILSSTWSMPFLEYVEKHLYDDLISHSCRFVSSKFAAFAEGLVATNNMSESLNHVIKCLSQHKDTPLDVIVMIFQQMQDMLHYDFLRGVTGFGNFQLKPEFEYCFTPRTEINFPKIKSMNQIVKEILFSERPKIPIMQKGLYFRNTQREIARICIERGLVGFSPQTRSFTVINPFTGKVHNVKYYPKPSKCSCPSSGLCFHILTVQMCLDEPDTDMKRKDKYSLSILLKNKRGKGKKSGRKRSRPQDYDYEVDPAPNALSPQDRKALGKPIASSTPTPHDQDFQNPENISQVAEGNKPGKCIYPWEIVSEGNTQQLLASIDLSGKVTNKAMLNCLSGTTWLIDDTLEYALQCVIHNAVSGENFLLCDTFFINYAENNIHDHIAAYACEKEAVNYDNFVFIVNPGAHWYLIIANLKSKQIFAVDSLIMISNRSIHKYMKNVLKILRAAYSVASLQIMEEE